MNFEYLIEAPYPVPNHQLYTIRDLIFNNLPGRKSNSIVLKGHQEEQLITVSLEELRAIIIALSPLFRKKGWKKGDTILLASFQSSNELYHALLFCALACHGIRVFLPIFPEAQETEAWLQATGFSAVIVPYRETQISKGHLREKETLHALEHFCKEHELRLWDSHFDFGIDYLLEEIKNGKEIEISDYFIDQVPQLHEEAVVFTTSGSQGNSKLIVYTQKSFSLSCLSWKSVGLFEPEMMGNACFTVLFCHTIGIRSLMNAIWNGQPLCLVIPEWLLTKPEVARYLLLQMKPVHLVGGPAFYNLLLEFFRQYPELKKGLKKSIKTMVSIGAPFDISTAKQVESAMGIPLMNAFGSTETQMISLNKQLGNSDSKRASMGFLLPGVSIGLKKTEEEDVFELHIKSSYGALRTIGEKRNSAFIDTGDLVTKINDELYFLKRKGTDWIKDDFGVKIPLESLQQYYPSLLKIARHIEWIPLQNMPGLGALVFLHPNFKELDANEIKEWIVKRNMEIKETVEPFEYEHRHLERFVLETGEIPLTRKGSISKSQLYHSYEDKIRKIKNSFSNDGTCHQVQQQEGTELQNYADPKLAQLLKTLDLDVSFHKGEKDWLYYLKNGKQVEVLDLVGGFGSNLLGHQHPMLKNTLLQFIESGHPALNTQGSQYYYPSLLSKELCLLFQEATGNRFKCMLGNTGAEVVEMALHHAYFDWWKQLEKLRDEQLRQFGSNENLDVLSIWEYNLSKAAAAVPAIVVMNQCFHGNSSGARSLLNFKKQRNKFSGLLKPLPVHLNDRDENWKEALQKKLEYQHVVIKMIVREAGQDCVKELKYSTVIASMVEPVRGEGGIIKAHTKIMDFLSQQEYPLIADEIQCGLGRTGNFPAYSKARYYLLGKSLGGGYEKIAALLIEKNKFQEDFPAHYVSTFAQGEMAACMALATINLLVKEQIVTKAQELGKTFKSKLLQVAAKYPDVIEGIEGEGLMLGVYFSHLPGKTNTVLRMLLEHELFGYLIAGWLFHNKQIRILPTLSRPDALRLEPSAYITEKQMNQFCSALEEVCRLIRIESIYELTRFLMNDDPYLDRKPAIKTHGFPREVEEAGMNTVKVGFIANFTAPIEELRLIEPDFQLASDTGLRILFDKLQVLLQGKSIHLFTKNLMEGRVSFSFYILPFDTSHLEAVNRWGNKKTYISRIQDAVNSLASKQCSHISLGAYCSILTGNGLQLASPKNCLIHTGNTLTVSSILYHVGSYLEREEYIGRKLTIAITGANGNIGSALSSSIAEKHPKHPILLIGNNPRKLENLAQSIRKFHQKITWSEDLYLLRKADIILCCTNSNDPLVFPHHLNKDSKVFLIDVAVPGSVDPSVKLLQNVEWCTKASSVYLPSEPDMLVSTHTPPGKIFCCAAEVMLAGLHHLNIALKGHLNVRPIKLMTELALQEGLFEKLTYANPL